MICFLYIGTFGSFIGFGFAFGQVLQVQFADTFDTPIKAATSRSSVRCSARSSARSVAGSPTASAARS